MLMLSRYPRLAPCPADSDYVEHLAVLPPLLNLCRRQSCRSFSVAPPIESQTTHRMDYIREKEMDEKRGRVI